MVGRRNEIDKRNRVTTVPLWASRGNILLYFFMAAFATISQIYFVYSPTMAVTFWSTGATGVLWVLFSLALGFHLGHKQMDRFEEEQMAEEEAQRIEKEENGRDSEKDVMIWW